MMICPDLSGKRKHLSLSLEDFTSSNVCKPQPPEPMVVKSWFHVGKSYATNGVLDYEAMAREIVDPELKKRALWRTWRTFPCRKIARVLPPNFATWTEYLEKGGVIDKSTGRGSLTRAEKRAFWSDQCSCKCWFPKQNKDPVQTLTPIKRLRGDFLEISYLETIDATRQDMEKKKEEERSIVSRVESFWKDLEQQFVDTCKRKGDGKEMIEWYWSFPLKQEFLHVYERFNRFEDVDV